MSPDATPHVPETLLAHTGWMRRLARTLVRDDAQADDVVQDAVVAALRAPPRDPVALPAWLASAVKNGARQLWRGESRRTARETAAARREASPGAAEVVLRAEEHGIVVQAVLALDEPHRSALLLRFYDDLPPREVAARLGVPVETAKARIRRGVEKLRERLDERHGGDGKAWRLALMPLVLHKTAAATAAGTATGAVAGNQLTTGAMVMAGSGTVAAVGGLALATGIACGWWFGATSSDAVAAKHVQTIEDTKKQLDAATLRASEADANLKRQVSQTADLDSKLRAAQKQAAETQKALDAAQAEVAQLKAAAQPKPAAPAAKGPRFAFSQYGKLSDVDWKSVGDNLNAMTPLCESVMSKLKKDGDLPGDDLGKLQQHNGPLVAAALKVMKDLPGTGPNGSFTHPAFQVNAIAATLEAAGKPLTDEEATALEAIGRRFSDEDAHRLESYDANTYALQKTYDEAELRRRFFEAAFAALTPEQVDTLSPPSIRGILSFDVFSDGLLWATVVRPLQFKEKDTDALVQEASAAMNSGLKIPREQQDAARAVVAKWVHDLPVSLVTASDDPGAQYAQHVETVRVAAKLTIALTRQLVSDLKLDGVQADAARKWPAVLLPEAQKAE
jgi:RNA polymerase sigma-70 factor (ECF subfamily)